MYHMGYENNRRAMVLKSDKSDKKIDLYWVDLMCCFDTYQCNIVCGSSWGLGWVMGVGGRCFWGVQLGGGGMLMTYA